MRSSLDGANPHYHNIVMQDESEGATQGTFFEDGREDAQGDHAHAISEGKIQPGGADQHSHKILGREIEAPSEFDMGDF